MAFRLLRISLTLALSSLVTACGGSSYEPVPVTPITAGARQGQDAQPDPKTSPSPKSDEKNPDGDVVLKDPADKVPEDPQGPAGSGGSGGAVGLKEVPFSGANVTSSYKINAPADAATGKLYGLHVHFHGDGGGGYRDFPNRETREALIGVAVKAPNANLQWWVGSPERYADYAQALIQSEILKKYNVDPKRIYFSGVSGGSYFLSGYFLPKYGQVYNSGAFLMCGGQPPQVAFVQPTFLKTFKILWQITGGERDDIVQDVQAGAASYLQALRQTGVTDTSKLQGLNSEGQGDHCEFLGGDYTSGIQAMMDQKFKVVLQ